MKLKPCPFCRTQKPIKLMGTGYFFHKSLGCPIDGSLFTPKEWNRRARPRRAKGGKGAK